MLTREQKQVFCFFFFSSREGIHSHNIMVQECRTTCINMYVYIDWTPELQCQKCEWQMRETGPMSLFCHLFHSFRVQTFVPRVVMWFRRKWALSCAASALDSSPSSLDFRRSSLTKSFLTLGESEEADLSKTGRCGWTLFISFP